MDREGEMQSYRMLQRQQHGKKPTAAGRLRRRGVKTRPHKAREYYKVICWPDLEDLITEVNEMCAGGWTPIGGVAVLHGVSPATGPAIFYFQALVADTDDEEEETDNEIHGTPFAGDCRLQAAEEKKG